MTLEEQIHAYVVEKLTLRAIAARCPGDSHKDVWRRLKDAGVVMRSTGARKGGAYRPRRTEAEKREALSAELLDDLAAGALPASTLAELKDYYGDPPKRIRVVVGQLLNAGKLALVSRGDHRNSPC